MPAPEGVEALRTRARRRLIGAALLLGIGIVLFGLLFETRPRPIPVDTPLVVKPVDRLPANGSDPASKSTGMQRGAVTPAASASTPQEAAAKAPEGVKPGATEAPASPSAAVADPVATAPPAPAVARAPAASAPAARASASAAVTAPREAVPAAPAASAEVKGARFVVQVGAFADAAAAREARMAVEKLGLKTYTQVVETEGGKRIRVRTGPYASRDEAAKALARIRAANLPGAVLAL